MFIRYLYTLTCICWFQYRVRTYNLCQFKNALKDSCCGHLHYDMVRGYKHFRTAYCCFHLVGTSVGGGSNPETLVCIYQIACTNNQQTAMWRQERHGSIMQQPLTVANLGMDVRSSGRVQKVWFGLVYLFIHSVTYVTLDTSITNYG
jgi:hypothetical protein